MVTPVFAATVTAHGKLVFADPETYEKYLRRLSGKSVEVVVRPEKRMRSSKQNDYVHAVIFRMLANEWGWNESEMKEFLLVKFAPRRHAEKGPGKIVRTSEMTTVQLNEFCEAIRRWALIEYQVYLPEPGEVAIN